MRKIKQLVLGMVAVVALAMTLTACGTASGSTLDASKVSCDQLQSMIAPYEGDTGLLKTDDANVAKVKGTPDEASAKAKQTKDFNDHDALVKRQNSAECKGKTSSAPSDGSASATNNGQTTIVPLVSGGTPVAGDSTADPRSPASYSYAALKAQGPVKNWGELAQRLGGQQWYVDGVNQRKAQTGFGWDDVKGSFANAKASDGKAAELRVIVVYNQTITDEQARAAVEPLIGHDDAQRLLIARYNRCIENTRGEEQNTLSNFVDCRQMTRVILARPVFDARGVTISVDPTAGVFVDCFNIVWQPQAIEVHPNPGVSVPTVPPTTPSKVCTLQPQPGYDVDALNCVYYKPQQTLDCKLNGGAGCPPNGGVRDPQEAKPTPIAGAPSTLPSNQPGPATSPNSKAPTVGSTDGYVAPTSSNAPGGSQCTKSASGTGCGTTSTSSPTPTPNQSNGGDSVPPTSVPTPG